MRCDDGFSSSFLPEVRYVIVTTRLPRGVLQVERRKEDSREISRGSVVLCCSRAGSVLQMEAKKKSRSLLSFGFFFFFLIGSELWTGVESNKFGCCGMTTKGAASEVWEWVFAVQNRLAELLHLTLTGAFSNAARKESHGQ